MSGGSQRDLHAARLKAIERLYRDEFGALVLGGEAISESADSVQAVLPGAFNPLHDGHRKMARIAAASLGVPVAFELSIENVDKPPLDIDAIEQCLSQFGNEQTICLTRAATFVQKVQLFGTVSFVVGADTMLRIADVRYYHNDTARRDRAVEKIVETGSRFLVFGRTMGDRFHTLSQLNIPEPLRGVCREVSEEEFQHDISSTEIRRATKRLGHE
ncbi:MAG: hypothetical protein O3C40_03375 [Planctomycetota bacterium]|nr:hypothetical protein [Planctomycetota bacterium]